MDENEARCFEGHLDEELSISLMRKKSIVRTNLVDILMRNTNDLCLIQEEKKPSDNVKIVGFFSDICFLFSFLLLRKRRCSFEKSTIRRSSSIVRTKLEETIVNR